MAKKQVKADLYRLTEEEMKNLSVFLGRVELKGAEVNAFNFVTVALSTPIVAEEKKEKPKK